MDDFHPLQVLKQVQPLAGLFEARQRLQDFLAKLDGNDQLDALLQSILASTERLQALKAETGGKHGGRHPQTGHPPTRARAPGGPGSRGAGGCQRHASRRRAQHAGAYRAGRRIAREESQKPYARDLIGELVTQVLDEGMTVQQDTVAAITARIAQLDTLISTQLNAIMHDEAFQTLEAAWRGLHDLVMQTKTSTRLKLRLLPATKKELLTDLEKPSSSIKYAVQEVVRRRVRHLWR